MPDVKRFIDAEVRGRPDLVVTEHATYVDHYRGYDYKVVSVRSRIVTCRDQTCAGNTPARPEDFTTICWARTDRQDAAGEAPYLLREAQNCLQGNTCQEYALHLLQLASPFLRESELTALAKGMIERRECLGDCPEHLEDPGRGSARSAELGYLRVACLLQLCRFTEAEALLTQEQKSRPGDSRLLELRREIDELLENPERVGAYDMEDVWRRVHLGIFLRHQGLLVESLEQLTRALELDPKHESALTHRRETLKNILRLALEAGDPAQALALVQMDAGGVASDAEWGRLVD